MSIQSQPYGDDFLSTLDHAEETMVWVTNMFRTRPSLGTVLASVHLVERELTSLQTVQHRARGNDDFHSVLSLYQDYLSLLQSVSRAEPKRRKSTHPASTTNNMGQTNTTLELPENTSSIIQPTHDVSVLGQSTVQGQQTSLSDAEIDGTPIYTAVQSSRTTLPVARVRPFHSALVAEGQGSPYQRPQKSSAAIRASASAGETVLILNQDSTGAGQPVILVENASTSSMNPASKSAKTGAGTGQPATNVRLPAQNSMHPVTNVRRHTPAVTSTNEPALFVSHAATTTGQPVILVQNASIISTQPIYDVMQSTQATSSTMQPASSMRLSTISTIQAASNMRQTIQPSTSAVQASSSMRQTIQLSTSTIQAASNMRQTIQPSTSAVQASSSMRQTIQLSTSTIQAASNMRQTIQPSTSTIQAAYNMRQTIQPSTSTIQAASNMRQTIQPSTSTIPAASNMRQTIQPSTIQAAYNMRQTIQPSTSTIQAASNMRKTIQPSVLTRQPASNMRQPIQPSTRTMQPASNMRQTIQLTTSSMQPASNIRQPIQSSTSTVLPASITRQPIQPSTSTMQPPSNMRQTIQLTTSTISPIGQPATTTLNQQQISGHEDSTIVSANTNTRAWEKRPSVIEYFRLFLYTGSDVPYHLPNNRGSTSGSNGPNSMWHLESLQKLHRWKMAIVMVVDDFSKKILAMKVATDNSSTTILEAFNMAVSEFGHPVAVRCDSNVNSQPLQEYMDRCSVNVVVGPSNNRNNGHKRMFFHFYDYFRQLLRLEETGDLNIWNNSNMFALHYSFVPHIQDSTEFFLEMQNYGNSRRGPDKTFIIGVNAEARCPYEGVGRFLDHCHKVWSGAEITLVPLPEGPPAPGNINPVQCPLTEEQLHHLEQTINPLTYSKDVETVYRAVRDYINHLPRLMVI